MPKQQSTKLHRVKRGESNDTMTPSEDSSISGHYGETFGKKSSIAWSNLNLLDASKDSTAHPSTEDLIDRNVNMIEGCIISVMNWRHRQVRGSIMSDSRSHRTDRAESSFEKLCNNEMDDNDNDGSISKLPEAAKLELELYVRTIANHYNNVLYHNFEHASHVTACVNQLITMLHDDSQSCTRPPELTSLSSSITSTTASTLSLIDIPSFGNFIKSNPIIHLSMVISALIHDVEHKGIGNKQLVDENDPLALKYKGKSVAENNSFDVATDFLYEDEFQNLRKCIFGEIDDGQSTLNKEVVERDLESYKSLFFQVSHDVVMATDISCPNRLKNGKLKWIKAFEQGSDTDLILSCGPQNDGFQNKNEKQDEKKRRGSYPQLNPNPCITRRSSTPHLSNNPTEFIADPFPDQTKLPRPQRTRELSWMSNLNLNGSTEIMCPLCETLSSRDDAFHCMSYTRLSSTLEQILQAADVGHTMQSWSVFCKWNEKLYNELWVANIQGRGPACHGQWFTGQLSFIDNYIFPLAQRLQQCGVFGPLGSLFYDNANSNKERWIIEGNDLCREMHDNATKMFGASQ